MIITLVDVPGYAKSWYDQERKIIVVKQLQFDVSHFRKDMFATHINAWETYKPTGVILDAGDCTGIFRPEDQPWLNETAFPVYKEKLKGPFIYVFPKNPIARVAAKAWMDMGRSHGMNFIETESVEEAYKILGEIGL